MAKISKYKTIFFDLDHTLWDYDRNSLETLTDIHQQYQLYEKYGVGFDKFNTTFHKVNGALWDRYNRGELDRNYIKQQRFVTILKKLQVDTSYSSDMSEQYLNNCPHKPHMMPYTLEVIEDLSQKYDLYILTNGFLDVQQIKLEKTGLKPFFKGMITSECCGYRKPDKEIFEYSLQLANTCAEDSMMIGDNLDTDVAGAMKASIAAVYFNPHQTAHNRTVTHEINCLSELTSIL